MAVGIYPSTYEQWIALFGVLLLVSTLAGTACWRAWTYHREQRQNEWKRLHELIGILHDGSKGLFLQFAAVGELRTIKVDKRTLSIVVDLAIKTCLQQGHVALADELKHLRAELPDS
jgi:hypothetical protein